MIKMHDFLNLIYYGDFWVIFCVQLIILDFNRKNFYKKLKNDSNKPL